MHGKARWRWLLFAGVLVLAGAVGLYGWLRPGTAVRTEPVTGAVVRFPRLSPDGKFLTYMDDDMQVVRLIDMAADTARELGPGDASGAKWSADGRYLYVHAQVNGPQTNTIYGPDMVPVLQSPDLSGDRWVVGWAADAPWLAVREADKSTTLQPVGGEGTPVPLFSSHVDLEPLLINRDAPSLGLRRTETRWELLQVERPGAPEQVVASGFSWTAFAPDGRSWVLSYDGQLVLQRDGEAPRELIPPGRYEWYRGAWSPDGKWIALMGENAETRRDDGLLFSADGRQVPLKLGSFQHLAELDVQQPIRWMPDSRTFAFVTFVGFLDGRPCAEWAHMVDATTGRERVWRLPHPGRHSLRDFQFVDGHTVLATLTDQLYQDRLYRYELR